MSFPESDEQESNLADRIAAGILARAAGEDLNTPTVESCRSPTQPPCDPRIDSVHVIIQEMDEFLRGWIGRLRQVVIRASQLAEQEAMLKSTLAAVDAQQAEWARQTEARERAIVQQTKMLTEAWLELEQQRREKLQHGGGSIARGTGQRLPQLSLQPVADTPISDSTAPVPTSDLYDQVSEPPTTDSPGNPAANQMIGEPGQPHAISTAENRAPESPTPPKTESPPSQSLAPSPLAGLAPNAPLPQNIANPSINPIDPWKNEAAGSTAPPTLSSAINNSPLNHSSCNAAGDSARVSNEPSNEGVSDAVKQFQRLRRDVRNTQNN